MRALKYLLVFFTVVGVLTLGYVIWFAKYVVLVGFVLYVLYKIGNIKEKFKNRKEKEL